MKNIMRMQRFQSQQSLYQNIPDFFFLEQNFLFFMVNNFLIKIAIIGKLHDYAELSICYHKFLFSKNTSLQLIMLLFLNEAKILTQFRAFYIYFQDKFPSFTFFNAYSFLSASLYTLQTVEQAPSPKLAELHLAWKSRKNPLGTFIIIYYLMNFLPSF